MLSPTAALVGQGLLDPSLSLPTGAFPADLGDGSLGTLHRKRSLAARAILLLSIGISSAKELTARKKKWKAPKPHYKNGILAEHAHRVSSASVGAVVDLRSAGCNFDPPGDRDFVARPYDAHTTARTPYVPQPGFRCQDLSGALAHSPTPYYT